MNLVFAIALGGASGAVLRHYAIALWVRVLGDGFPYGTLFVNVLGSFLIGFLMELGALKFQIPLELRALLVTGMLGGFTTFSAFSLDMFKLIETGHAINAALYALASVALSLAALFSAVYIVRGVTG
jgi:CrcB protein